ncbi:MAG: hypothetical protein ABI972_11730 [Acidobacteriota bacterium]
MLRRHSFPLLATPFVPSARAADAARLALIRKRMEDAVGRGAMPGAVTLVAHKGKVVHHEAAGYLDVSRSKPEDTGRNAFLEIAEAALIS